MVKILAWHGAKLYKKSQNLTAATSTGLVDGLKETVFNSVQNKRIKYSTANARFFLFWGKKKNLTL